MEIKVNRKILNEQIEILDTYAGLIIYSNLREMVDGVVNMLSEISCALEHEKEIYIVETEEE